MHFVTTSIYDRITRYSPGGESVQVCDLMIVLLLFTKDVVLVALPGSDLQHTLGRSAANQ